MSSHTFMLIIDYRRRVWSLKWSIFCSHFFKAKGSILKTVDHCISLLYTEHITQRWPHLNVIAWKSTWILKVEMDFNKGGDYLISLSEVGVDRGQNIGKTLEVPIAKINRINSALQRITSGSKSSNVVRVANSFWIIEPKGQDYGSWIFYKSRRKFWVHYWRQKCHELKKKKIRVRKWCIKEK